MRAVRLTSAKQLEHVTVPDPAPAAGEVVVRVHACGICGSDLSCYKHGIFAGVVLGHELSGAIVASRAPAWEEGARVVVDPKIPCGACADCAAGAEQRCTTGMTQGIGQVRDGGFAEYVAAPATCLHRAPDDLDLIVASLAEPLAVALHGLARADATAEPAVVFGLGPIGLLAVAGLAARGATPIVGVDPVAERRALAASVGASVVVAPGDGAIADAEATLVLETSGNPAAVAAATTAGRPGARVVLLGISMGPSTVYPMAMVTREVTVMGSIAHDARDWSDALALLRARPAIGDIITDRIALAEAPAAFERLTSSADAGKIAVLPA